MDSVNVEVLRCAANWVDAGTAVMLATVVKTWGSCIEDDLIESLHGPVGLPLGSKTPPEIALAIVADITARRNGVELVCRSPVAACAESSAICPVLA